MRCRRLFNYFFSAYVSITKPLSTALGALTLQNHFAQRNYGFGSGGLQKHGHQCFCYLAVLLLFIYSIIITCHRFFHPQLPGQGFISSSQLDAGVNHVIQGYGSNNCDIFSGKWVPDSTYPLYTASACPFAELGFRCQNNGREDKDYLKWRWQPLSCDIPRFNAPDILRRLQGLRVVFVGDSMARTQWESLICLLMQGVADRQSVYEVNGNKIAKRIPYLGVRFSTFNFTIEYYRSPFLVRQGSPPKHAPRRVHSTLKLDKPDVANKKWREADLLIFNAGHWWTPSKTYEIYSSWPSSFSYLRNMAFISVMGEGLLWAENPRLHCYRFMVKNPSGLMPVLRDGKHGQANGKHGQASSPSLLSKCTRNNLLLIDGWSSNCLLELHSGKIAEFLDKHYAENTLKTTMEFREVGSKIFPIFTNWLQSKDLGSSYRDEFVGELVGFDRQLQNHNTKDIVHDIDAGVGWGNPSFGKIPG